MTKRKLVLSAVVIAIASSAIGIGAWTLFASTSPAADAAPCRCPEIYAPVTCDHGHTYPNQCVADCHHAKNCVPAGIL